jgi:hypothetical protein
MAGIGNREALVSIVNQHQEVLQISHRANTEAEAVKKEKPRIGQQVTGYHFVTVAIILTRRFNEAQVY